MSTKATPATSVTDQLIFVMRDGARLTVFRGQTLKDHIGRGPAIAVSAVAKVEVRTTPGGQA